MGLVVLEVSVTENDSGNGTEGECNLCLGVRLCEFMGAGNSAFG